MVGSNWMWYSTLVMHPRPENVSAYLCRVSLVRVSTLCTSFISVLAFKPRTLETLSKTSNSIGHNLLLYSHISDALPIDVRRCPPNAMSLAFDLVRGCEPIVW